MCIVVAAVIHYFYMVGFSWMLFEGIYLYLLVCKVFNAFIRIRIFYAVAWGRFNVGGFAPFPSILSRALTSFLCVLKFTYKYIVQVRIWFTC